MIAPPSAHDVRTFRDIVTRRLGLQFDDAKLGFLAEIMTRRLRTLRRPAESYLWSLEREPSADELGALAQELTVTETYFFRHNEQFRALADSALPKRMQVARTPKILRLLSAGCASGEEAYTLAIVARETVVDPSWAVTIRAVDLNPAALEKAGRARYSAWALRETPKDTQRKWFHPDGPDLVLDEAARATVTFEARNLAAQDSDLWQSNTYDAIFCRNVLMYFSPHQMRAVVANIAQALAPGGFLFLGHAETLRGISDDFHLCHTHETFYYERKDRGAPTALGPVHARSGATALPAAPLDQTWVEAIADASRRVAALIPTQPPASSPQHPPSAWTKAEALDLLLQERFAEALVYVRQGPPQADRDPDILLLEAALLVHGGRLAAAEDACHRLLLIDELNAEAHYVLALCREGLGDADGAAEHDRVAVYLDPAFAMPRLHLGLLTRRLGDRDSARRELQHALILLESEFASRLLLFGGGFNRQALIDLCVAALRDCGGRP